MTFVTDDQGRATVIVEVGGIERGRFRFRGIDGVEFPPLATVEVDEARIRAAALKFKILVTEDDSYECRSAAYSSVSGQPGDKPQP